MANVLIACEESQVVTIAFREMGHAALSCDLKGTSGPYPEWHYQGDVRDLLDDESQTWDLVIAFPPCTHLAASGALYFSEKRKDGRQRAAMDFFMYFFDIDCPRVAVENPVGIMSTEYKPPTQIVQPHFFGHNEQKATCLWLKGLPPLEPTINCSGREQRTLKLSGSDRAAERSKTPIGMAHAMARQWGPLL